MILKHNLAWGGNMDIQLKKQLQQTVFIAVPDTVNYKTGESIHGSPSSYSSRVIGKQRRVVGRDGVEVVSSRQLVLASSMSEDCSQLFWLPEDDHADFSKGRAPLSISNYVDENGVYDWTEVFLK